MNARTALEGRRLVTNKACFLQRRVDDRKNAILACLPDADFARLRSSLELVHVTKGQRLFDCGVSPAHVYFPVTAVVGLVHVLNDGATLEMASVGSDGMVGICVFMGGNSTSSAAIVVGDGTLLRLPARELLAAFHRGGALQHLFLRYTQALLTQMTLTAACNRHHTLFQQLCRRLLMSSDQTRGEDINQTQEAIAQALGVRREGVTAEAVKLKYARAIAYERGCIKVLDRSKLESGTCECYALVRKERQRLLPNSVAT